MPIPCLLDCDPGHDDAVALLLAAAHPALELRAITTVGGQRAARQGDAERAPGLHARGHPRRADRGRRGGAAGGTLEPAVDVHGESGLDGPELPEPDVPLDPRSAVELIGETLAVAHEPVTLFATGPLTNIAAALERVDRERIREIVWMGGSTERGNRTPVRGVQRLGRSGRGAAVLASGVPLHDGRAQPHPPGAATPDVVARMHALGTPLGDTVAGWFEFFGANYLSCSAHARAARPRPVRGRARRRAGLVRCVDAFMAVETDGRWTRGATVVDLHGRLGREPNARSRWSSTRALLGRRRGRGRAAGVTTSGRVRSVGYAPSVRHLTLRRRASA